MTQITTRTNFYLWLLTGRTDDFANTLLNNGIWYSAAETPAEITEVRALLRLDDTRSDFYVLGALGPALASTALLRSMPEDRDAVFKGGLLVLPTATSSATLLPPDSYSWPSVTGVHAGRDGFTQVTFTYSSATEIAITTDAGGSALSAYELTPIDGGIFRLHIAKSADFGIKADFSVAGWSGGSPPIVVGVAPTRYPYSNVCDQISRNTAAINMMTEEGTMQAYAESSNPARKVGLLAIAIMRRMLKKINEDQAGFSVTTELDENLQRTYDITPALVADDVPKPLGFDA